MRHFAREILNFLQNLLDYRLPVGAGHCGVVSVGPRLSGAKPGSEQCLPPRGKQPHERASFAGWRRSLCAAKRPARRSARPPFNGQLPLMLQAGHARPLPRGCHRLPRRGQDPSLRAIVHGCFVGSGLDRSAGWADVSGLARRGGIHAAREPCAAANTPGGINSSPTHCPQTTACMAGRRGRRPLRRAAFLFVPPGANSTCLLSIIYLLFAPFVV